MIDAALVLLIGEGDEVLTSDPDDVRVLCESANVSVDIVPV